MGRVLVVEVLEGLLVAGGEPLHQPGLPLDGGQVRLRSHSSTIETIVER